MYNEKHIRSPLAYRPIPHSNSCLNLSIFDDDFKEFDHSNDSLDLCSSVSPTSFSGTSDSFNYISDDLLNQIISEYSCESFPVFSDIDILSDPHDIDVLSDLFADNYDNINVTNSNNSYMLDPCFDYPLCREQIPNFIPFSVTATQSTSSKTSIPHNNKRKSSFLHTDTTPVHPIKKPKRSFNIDLSLEVPETISKTSNRDAAYRYRQKQKVKKSKDENELDIATDEMLKAKDEMLTMRQSMQTMKNLVSELLSQF